MLWKCFRLGNADSPLLQWSQPPILDFSVFHSKTYKADRNSECVYDVSEDRKELRIKGVRADYVKTLSLAGLDVYRYGPAPVRERITGWQTSCAVASTLKSCPTGETVQEALWRTLCWNVDLQGNSPAPTETVMSFEKWYSSIRSSSADGGTNNCSFSRLINSTAPVCVTSQGFLASVPYTTKVGDCIVILTGGRLPFVLRHVGSSHYRLIGPCYVHGIMNGEAFPEHHEDLDNFAIR